ncbi:MAG: DUF2784 domain-containing protein [Calditrichaeota bacterium]|nr:MAG: DUF2784 domain-containing protein [Calditrichota bacterium]
MTSILADLVLILHFAFVLFVILGQVLILIGWAKKWSWTRNLIFRISHLFAILFVVLESWLGITCPLTTLEFALRESLGEKIEATSFVALWVHKILFYSAPEWVFTICYSVFGLVVVLSFIFYRPKKTNGFELIRWLKAI